MTDWQPIETAPTDGTMIEAKERYVKPWPQSSRTLYVIRETQWVKGEGWIYYSKDRAFLWAPDRWRPRAAVGRPS